MKKAVISLIALVLALSMLAVSAFAASGENKGKIQPPAQGERQEFGGRGRNDSRGNSPRVRLEINSEDIEAAIAELDDSTKADISELMEKYSAACDAIQAAIDSKAGNAELDELQQEAREAWSALSEALKQAGVETDRPGVGDDRPERPQDIQRGGRGLSGMFDAEAVKEAIDALEDEALKAELTELMENWNDVCEKQQAAFDKESELDDEQKKQLTEESREAHRALAAALEEAGIELNAVRPEKPQRSDKPQSENDSAAAEESVGPTEAPAETKAAKGGFFNGLVNWLNGLLG